MLKKEWTKHKWMVLIFLSGALNGLAQTSIVKGVVKDVDTKLPLPSVTITIKNVPGGVISDARGGFSVKYDKPFSQLIFSIVGYKNKTLSVKSVLYSDYLADSSLVYNAIDGADTAKLAKPDSLMHVMDPLQQDQNIEAGQENLIVVYMQPNSNLLKAVTIKSKRQKYRNKGNPAVDLIRRVIDNKPRNRMESFQYSQYEKYEKLQISIDNLSEKVRNSKLTKKYHFLFENADTLIIPGKALLPIYLEEKISHEYYRANPQKHKTIVVAHKRVDFGEFVDMHGVSNYLNRLYADVNIYDNNIPLFTNLFLSPIADMAPTFYMFFISDTVIEDGLKFVRLTFRPRNPNDFLFRGTLYITLDSNYAVQKFTMFTSKNINLNFVRELRISQDFVRRDDGRYFLSKSNVVGDLGIFKKGTGVFGQRTVSYKNFMENEPIPDSIFKGPPLVELQQPASGQVQDTFWARHRHDTLSTAESKVYANIDSLKSMPSFRRLMDWATLLLAGYKQAGPFEIGPASTFYSFNPVEGFRLRFGGRTTPKLSNRMYFETYAAYGFKDQKWKYFFSSTYSLNNKSVYSFPLNYIRASYQHDTKIPGQDLQFVQEDNFLLSFKRGNNDKWLYNDFFKLNYVYEFGNHFSYDIGLKYWKQYPAGSLQYIKDADPDADTLNNITTGEASLQFRWAPNEQFYQGKLYRVPIFNKYPVFTLRYIAGIKGLFGGNYNYQNLTLNIFKRFYISQLGYSDVTVEGGYIFGKVPFPLMEIHHANQTYAYQLTSYNLMNFLEFVSDHYVSVDWDHYFNGFFFNKIPLLKKLKLREVIEGKMVYGGVRNENLDIETGQLKYPMTNNMTTTFPLGREPYLEAGFGISNIFKLVRVDLIKRFTYLDHPQISTLGVRARVKFDF
ncbi:MAG: carboxypeptidase-like regulatory domain-containing protein [Bacteroidetes bacterium]|nr:carboxypeptidase-like regulatory domain-containing protein [Bacteroidota bacterium]MBS1972823.1 carboxypeptidase-like regulatory domain-containing protein [Bacteroidota bacterium]